MKRAQLTLVLLLFLAPALGAQSPAAAKTPRTSWGTPSFQGVWVNSTVTPLTRPKGLGDKEFYTKEELEKLPSPDDAVIEGTLSVLPKREQELQVEFTPIWMDPAAASGRTSLIVGPTGMMPPLTPAGKERMAAVRNPDMNQVADSYEDRSLAERCLRSRAAGPPMSAYPFSPMLQIFQTPDYVVFLHEENHETRIIPLGGAPHVGGALRLWSGDSRGRWEGDTLVIETTNFNGRAPNASATLQLTERLTRADSATILYRYTMNDPETWTEPWTVEMPLRASPKRIYEWACHEGNQSLPLILNGARAQERAAQAK